MLTSTSNPLSSIRAITLDLDDTLWPIQPVIIAAEDHLYRWLSEHCPRVTSRYTPEQIRDIRLQTAQQHPEHGHDLTRLRKLALEQILSDSGYDGHWVERAFDQFMQLRNRVEFFPDALPALTTLAANLPIASISNGNADLARIGISHLFAACISAREVGAAKPHRDVFLAACRALRCGPSQVLHIGDHPVQDILGAAEAGLRTLWLNRGGQHWHHPRRADAEASDLLEVVRILSLR